MMRVSSLIMHEKSVASLTRQQSEFFKVGNQIASGQRMVNPADDPQAASRAVGVAQSKAINEQYADARTGARNTLNQTEGVLDGMGDAITRARTLSIQAASDTTSPADRQSIATELRGVLESMLGQANATDGNGRYLFAGYKDDQPPFVRDAQGGIDYQGDDNVRQQRVDDSRLMAVTDNGKELFAGLLDTMQNFIATLEAPQDSTNARDASRAAISTVMRDLDTSFDKVLTTRASVGARLNELEALDTIGASRNINYARTLSELQDLDYVEAAAEYSLRQVGLQAAQKTFVNVQKLSLFNSM